MRLLNKARYAAARRLGRFPLVRAVRDRLFPARKLPFQTSAQYWNDRYESGGNSGEGSYGPLARYKADFINDFLDREAVASGIELGCGDGNQASLLRFPSYIGVDISDKCIDWARRHVRRPGWSFMTLDAFQQSSPRPTAEVGLSLDVVYHLVEDEVYRRYLADLFAASTRFVIVYSSDRDDYDPAFPHVRHRPVVDDIARAHPGWAHVETFDNPFYREPDAQGYGSFARFHLFAKR